MDDKRLEFIKSPAILEFLEISENNGYLEKDLENCLIQNLKGFLISLIYYLIKLGKTPKFCDNQNRN